MIPTRVYIGNLPLSVRERDIEDLFYKAREPGGLAGRRGVRAQRGAAVLSADECRAVGA